MARRAKDCGIIHQATGAHHKAEAVVIRIGKKPI
jgi:hypothetical protein